MGVIPENRTARLFSDLQGWVNQALATRANEQYFLVSGSAIRIK
jgi:adenosylcobinamide kinase / adenosylcobinamide-phosphate guanylyltransferase